MTTLLVCIERLPTLCVYICIKNSKNKTTSRTAYSQRGGVVRTASPLTVYACASTFRVLWDPLVIKMFTLQCVFDYIPNKANTVRVSQSVPAPQTTGRQYILFRLHHSHGDDLCTPEPNYALKFP